jgi:peptidoglycan/xylan/chitin deacetylase (PgdA/CDA1 family)
MRAGSRAGLAAITGSALAGGFYWVFLSPYCQVLGPHPWRGAGDERVVALTFDDGPNEPYTSQLAELLRERGVRATFFQVGRCVERSPASTAALAADGHVIGNHSLSHQMLTYFRRGAFAAEIEDTQKILTRILGKEPALVRMPWLWRQPALLSMLRTRGMRPVSGVFCHAFEVFQVDAARIAHRAVAKTRPGAVLIFHDGYNAGGAARAETVKAVRMTIDALRVYGYRFVTVDELLRVPAYRSSSLPLD